MTDLQPRWLHPDMASGQEMAAAGGLWLVEGQADRAAVVAEVRERGLRALEVAGDLSFLAEVPELEFLVARDPPDVAPIHALAKLRLLSFPGTWGGRDTQVPDDVRTWLAEIHHSTWPPLAAEAVHALDRVLTASELRELWDEAEDGSWAADTGALRDRVAAAAGANHA